MFETEDRLLVQVEAFVNAQYGYDIRCEIVGESGTLTLAAPAAVRMQRDGRAGIEVPTRFQERFASAYELELRAWGRLDPGRKRGRRERVGRLRGRIGVRSRLGVAQRSAADRRLARVQTGSVRLGPSAHNI